MTPALPGCGDGGGDGGGLSGEALAIMEKVPGDASECTFLDLGAMRRDNDLKGIYQSTTWRLSGSEDAGLPTDNVDRMVQAGSLTILEGRFDLPSLEGQMKNGGYVESDHQGTSIWQGPSSSIALVSSGCVVTGWDAAEVADCIDVINGGGDTFCDKDDVRDLLGRLPGGFTINVFAGGEGFADAYQGVQAVGYSLAKASSNRARMAVVLAFEDAIAAGKAEGGVEAMLTRESAPPGPDSVSVARDGRYVTATGLMSIEGPAY